MTKLKVIPHTIKKEFRRERCGCDHNPPDDFFKSQWQSRTKSNAYLIYRWIIALFFTGVVIKSMTDHNDDYSFWLYFIYLTNWGILMCMATNWLVAVLVSIWHFHPELTDRLINMQSLTSPFRIYWSMHMITLVLSIVITTIYWSVLYDAARDGLTATNVLTHACNSIIMFIDLWIVAHPMRLLHMFLPVLFGIIYTIFSVIYQLCGGINNLGQPFIYNVLDWNKPVAALLTNLGTIILTCCVYMVLFLIYKLRLAISRRFNDKYVLPTTAPNNVKIAKSDGKANSVESVIQHTPSGISMLGQQNPAFQASKENISN